MPPAQFIDLTSDDENDKIDRKPPAPPVFRRPPPLMRPFPASFPTPDRTTGSGDDRRSLPLQPQSPPIVKNETAIQPNFVNDTSAQTSIPGLPPASSNGLRKRTARDAFGHNGVSELIDRALQGQSDQFKPKSSSSTPGRTSIWDLLARAASPSDEGSPARSTSPTRKRQRSKPPVQPSRVQTHEEASLNTLASLVHRAEADVGTHTLGHVHKKSSSFAQPAVREPGESFADVSKVSVESSADHPSPNGFQALKLNSGDWNRMRSNGDSLTNHQLSASRAATVRTSEPAELALLSHGLQSRKQQAEANNTKSSVPAQQIARSKTNNSNGNLQRLSSHGSGSVQARPNSTSVNTAFNTPPSVPTDRAQETRVDSSRSSVAQGEKTTRKSHLAQQSSFPQAPALSPVIGSTVPPSPVLVDRPRTSNYNSPLLSPRRSSHREKSPGSPVTPRMPEMPPLEGLGISPRLIRIEDASPQMPPQAPNPFQSRNESTTRDSSISLPPKPTSAFQTVAATTFSSIDIADPIRQSIEVAPPDLSATQGGPRQSTINVTQRPPADGGPKRRFLNSQLASRTGRPWIDAEVILAAHVYEVLHWKWTDVDRKMGRTYNSCATKYCRVPTGLKTSTTRTKMRFHERSLAIEALLRTMDLDMEGVVAHLQSFINTGQLSEQARLEYQRLLLQYPAPLEAIPPPAPAMRESIVVSESSRTTPASGSDNAITIATTRKRRGMVDEIAIVPGTRLRPGPRLADGQLDQLALSHHRRASTPDSVLASSEHEVVQIKVYEPLKRSKIRLFDGLKNVDEEMTGLFVQRKKPYLSVKERAYLERAVSEEDAKGWQGTTLHMDFDLTETATIIEAIKAACAELYVSRYRGRPQKMLASATKGQLAAIAAYAAEDDRLAARTRHSIKSFLHDTKSGQTTLQAYRLRLASVAKHPISERVASSGQLLNRELGLRSRKHNPRRKIRDAIYETMSVTRTFTGASGDVGNLAWSKDGRYFAAGSACLVDPSSMQYNQPNNLLFGNQDTLYELPDHHRPREKPTQGVNATHSMHVSQDSRLFETVSMVEFSRDGDKLFSVGYDDHLRVYSIEGGRCSLLSSLNHSTKIDLLDVNKYHKVLATGSQSIGSSIKVFGYSPEGIQNVSSFTSKRAQTLIERRIMPSALRWGDAPAVSGYLLAGFASASIDSSAQSAYGELCLWDVEKQMQIQVAPAAGNIFDANWNPASSHVAAACAAIGMNFNRGTNSVVRVYNALQDATGLKWTSRGLEMECPALDINDVLFNPYNDRQVAAGATDGSVYVWDLRRSDETLHRFSHGEPVMPLDPNWSREAFDTGVRFCAWGDRAARLYTGSSDGVVKVWDTACSGHDAHVKDVATFNSGVMSGAFTEDFSRLLIGEVNGSINLVEIAADPVPRTELEKFTLVPCDVPSTSSVSATELDVDSGIALSQQLVAECKIEIKPFGGLPKSQAVRGPNYTGPFDYSDSAERNRHKALALQNLYRVEGPQCKHLACKEAGRHFSNPNGDVEDSERSRDRIPQAMRDAVTTSGNTGRQKKERMPTTTLTCMHCSAPARVREENLSQAAFPLCERCSFACLRCGMACRKISPKVERVTCSSCGGVWDIGVLRYTAVSKGSRGRREEGSGVVMAEKEGVPLANEADEGPLGKLGDLLDLVGEWHHSLWGSEPLGSG